MWQTCALLIALATAAPDPSPLPAEPPRAYQCRSLHQPRARACAARCEAAFPGEARDARFDCMTACTRKALHAVADCRRDEGPLPAAPLASR